ncbi:MAG: hypothetical protein Q8R02_14925 [Hyphomonadaceae bacterium]|nr:hypothetical protein [Hyphomonadaceae bacterium]
MWRSLAFVCVATGIHLVSAASAVAQSAPDTSCPRAPLSIYFASGDVTASPQAQELLGRIGETVTSCAPDRIDLIAHIDASVDGARAVTVALQRLNMVAGDLVARGLPADRIRVAARAPEAGEPVVGPNQINILFRKAEPAPDSPTPVSQPPVRTAPSQSI